MIPAHKHLTERSGMDRDFIRTRAISDHIAKVKYPIVLRRGAKTRLQSFEITVHVAEQEYAHESWSVGTVGEPERNGDYKARALLVTGHLAQCDGATSSRGGSSRAHASTRNSHRGSKGHPGGMAFTAGTEPSMVRKGCVRLDFSVGTAPSNPRVYGWAGLRKMSSRDPS